MNVNNIIKIPRCMVSSMKMVQSPNKMLNMAKDPLYDDFNRKHTYLRISLTERCNLRCLYCMPEEGISLTPSSNLLTRKEINQLVGYFIQRGVTKIRLTGGEPLLRKDLVDIVGDLNLYRDQGLQSIGMTTNGITLSRNIVALKEAGLDSVNVSLDTLVPVKFEFLTRRNRLGLNKVYQSIDACLTAGLPVVKVNCVLMRGRNDDEILDFVRLTKDKPLDVRFIEYMPFGGNKWDMKRMMSYAETLHVIKQEFPDLTRLSDRPNDTSKAYRVPGHFGQIGFISSMTEHFCGSCNRLRITADGNLKVCLHGNAEVSLRDIIRNNLAEDAFIPILEDVVDKALFNKKSKHAGMKKLSELKNRPMILIENMLPDYRSHSYRKKHNTSVILSSNIIKSCPAQFMSIRNFTTSTFLFTENDNEHTDQEKPILSHVDYEGNVTMVDVSHKTYSKRVAKSVAHVKMSPACFTALKDNSIIKGDVLTTAKISAIQAAKRTSDFIPLCHNEKISWINVQFSLDSKSCIVKIYCEVCTNSAQTGVEMESLVGASIAALTLYDMCKSIDKAIVISEVKLLRKTGGKSGDFIQEESV